jgi:protein-S-isoprenylcysteine O-methyltransferase Ste14
MNQQDALRAVLFAIFLVLFPIGLRYRIESQATGETLDRRQEGLFILATLRPAGAIMWFGLMAWIIRPDWMAWSSVPLPLGVRWGGIAMFAVGCALVLWTFRSLGPNLTDTVVTRESHTLIVHGPYRWIRHPLYDAVALLTVATALVTANWFLFVSGLLVLSLLIVRTSTEEANLVARFGDGYRGYMARTGRFLPRLR